MWPSRTCAPSTDPINFGPVPSLLWIELLLCDIHRMSGRAEASGRIARGWSASGGSRKGTSVQLVRLGEPGSERPFVRAGDGKIHELASLTADIDGRFLAADGLARTA